MQAKILKYLPAEYTEYGDSGEYRFTVRCKGKPTDRVLYSLGLWHYSCRCAHDCCGHIQYSHACVVRRNKRNEWYVTQHFYRNV